MAGIAWTIPNLLKLSGDYWGACALHASVRLDIFSPLNGVTLTGKELAASCQCEPRAVEMLLDALVSMSLINKTLEGYTDTGFTAQYLVKSSPNYLGHIIMHHHYLMNSWALLHESIKSGLPVRERVSHGDDMGERESFLMGMYNLASQLAPRVASLVNLNDRTRLLDLGGGPGTYAIHFCYQNPDMNAVVFDLPSTRSFAESTIKRHCLSERISFLSGNYNTDMLPLAFDVAWLSHILHSEGSDGCKSILLKAVQSLMPGGMLLVQEFILNDDKAGPTFPALFSLNMLVCTPEGQSYSEAELVEMMESAGLADVHRLPIELPNGVGIMVGSVV